MANKYALTNASASAIAIVEGDSRLIDGRDPKQLQTDPNGNNYAGVIAITREVTAGGGGSADDFTIWAVQTDNYDIVDATFRVTAGDAPGFWVQLRDTAGGGGSAYSDDTFDCGSAGVKRCSIVSTAALMGLYLRRSDSAIAGTLTIFVRRIVGA